MIYDSWKKTFAIIWTGQLASILSSSVVGYAVVFWLSIKTGSAEVLAISTIAALLPQSVLGLFTGVYIDRWKRKLTMISADIFISLCTLVIVILFFYGRVETWQIYFLLAARSAGSAFHIPAMQASVPLLAPESELMRIAGINQVIISISSIAGPVIGALLITWFDMSYVLMFDIAGALIGVCTLMMVSIPDPEKKEGMKPHFIREIKEGLHEIYRHKAILFVFLLTITALFFIMPVGALFPLMTLNHFKGSVFQMSIVEVFWGAGMLAGGGLVGLNLIKSDKALLICWMFIIVGITFFLAGLLPESGFIFFVILTAIGGTCAAINYSSFTALVQEKINPAVLGRVFSTYGSVTILPSMLGLLGTGYAADTIGITTTFIICGAGVSLAAIVTMIRVNGLTD